MWTDVWIAAHVCVWLCVRISHAEGAIHAKLRSYKKSISFASAAGFLNPT